MFLVTLEGGHSWITLLVVALVALVLTIFFYRRGVLRTSSGKGRLRGRILLGLRLAVVLLVVLLLFRPVLSMQSETTSKRSLILVLDQSASMATTDEAGGSSRFDQARNRLLDWSKRLAKDFDLHLIAFADQAVPVADFKELGNLQPNGEATSLTRALNTAAGAVPRRDIEAIVLLSDGVHNAAGDPVATARKLGVVTHTIGVGSSLRGNSSYRDIAVTGLECPPQLPINNQARIVGFVDAIGFGGHVVKVQLEEDGKKIEEAELVLDNVEGPQEVAFQFLPTVKGRHTYTVRVPVQPEEKISQNNHRAAEALVVDARIRVLYIEGTLRAEYGALVDRFLSKDADIEFCALVQTRRNVFLQRTNMAGIKLDAIPTDPAILGKFDVVVIGDLDSSFLKPAQMELLNKRVREGAGLLMLGGYNSLGPGGYGGTLLEEILPVAVGGRNIGQITEPFLPVLTPEGRGHPIFANITPFFPTQDAAPSADPPGKGTRNVNEGPKVTGLPPLEGCVRVGRAKAGASVLAVHPTSQMAVLAVHRIGKGRAAVFTGDTTRNWQQVPRALDRDSPFLRFWGQIIRWTANRTEEVKGEASIAARTDKAYYEPDSPIGLLAVVRNKNGEGDTKAQVTARVKGPDGQETVQPLALVPGPPGNYAGSFEPKRSGSYEIIVEARLGATGPAVSAARLLAETIKVEVGRPNLEFDRLDLDEKMLGRIASATGGRYWHLSTADRLLDELDRKEQTRRLMLEQPLYWPPLFMTLVVGLLTTEWAIRKRYQLR